ncbi:MAG: DNA-directed RNA polymerase subunit omega [Zavarzinella sp.]
MFEALKEEDIINRVNGRFKLCTLVQKRIVQFKKGGGKPLVDVGPDSKDNMFVALAEILHDKIYLDPEADMQAEDNQLPQAEESVEETL